MHTHKPSTCLWRRGARWMTVALVATLAAPLAAAGINGWSGAGPDGGRVDQIIVDPGDPDRLYAVGQGAGAFVSDDAGASWATLDVATADITPGFISDLAVDPSNPSTLFVVDNGPQIARSLDGGTTWSTFSSGIDQNLYYLYPDPGTAGTVYASALYGLFKSTDNGETFTAITGLGLSVIDSLFFDPQNSQRVFAAGWEGVFRSTDGGASWSQLTTGLPAPNASGYVFARVGAVDPQDSDIVYVHVSNSGVHKSTDGGDTWTAANANQPNDFFRRLMIDPTNSSRIYLASGNNDLVVSTNAAASWQDLPNVGLGDYTINDADFAPGNPVRLYAASSKKGIFVTTDAGATWAPSSSGYVNTNVESLSVDAVSGQIYAGVNGGTAMSLDGGASWTGNAGDYDLTSFAIRADELLPGHAWAGSSCCGLYETFDGGQTWARINLGLPTVASWVTDIEIPAGHPQTLLFTDYNRGLFASPDRGQSWSDLTPGLQPEFSGNVVLDSVSAFAGNPAVLYVGSPSFSDGGVFTSSDGGVTWERKSGAGVPGPTRVSSVAVHPLDASVVFAGGTSSGLWASTDGGDSWQPVSVGTAGGVVDIYIDAQHPGLMYFASASGNLQRSVDGGASWQAAPAVAGAARINALAVDPANVSRVLLGFDSIGYREYTFATDLDVAVSASTTAPMPGEQVVLTVTATNNGPLVANAADVSLAWPASLTAVQASASQGACTIGAGELNCALDTLGDGASATVSVTVEALATDSAEVAVTLTALESDSDGADSTTAITLMIAGATDSDGDGIDDTIDNCVLAANPAQIDADGDGYGNACDADFDNDCIVNTVDLGIFSAVFFGSDANADLNSDGIVNPIDLGILRGLFFGTPGPAGAGGICD